MFLKGAVGPHHPASSGAMGFLAVGSPESRVSRHREPYADGGAVQPNEFEHFVACAPSVCAAAGVKKHFAVRKHFGVRKTMLGTWFGHDLGDDGNRQM
jgi:hypothetical protein